MREVVSQIICKGCEVMHCPKCRQQTGAPDWKAKEHILWKNQYGHNIRIFCDCGWWHDCKHIYGKRMSTTIVKRPEIAKKKAFLKKSHKHKLPKRQESNLTSQILERRGWFMRSHTPNALWRLNIWNEAHKITHRSLNWWWCQQNIPF